MNGISSQRQSPLHLSPHPHSLKLKRRRLSRRCSCFSPLSSWDTVFFICLMSMPLRRCGDVPEKSWAFWSSHRSDHLHTPGPPNSCPAVASGGSSLGATEKQVDRGPMGGSLTSYWACRFLGLLAQEAEDIGEVLIPGSH